MPVIFIPGLTIYQKSETAAIYYFHQNFASEIALNLSYDLKLIEHHHLLYCDFRSDKNQFRTEARTTTTNISEPESLTEVTVYCTMP